ncbi:tetratricopeptide repeat protein [Actinomadura xylanilytica]|uniref:tetratricopeptide repeat protein n=1 Tax=Actinomadura xylanilytica TaxID=887459 RepID=UPI00255A8C1F|nr:tetratricopeptide repeat protein [Actinomadura xylanilytica]MDL4774548.1 tetratricopeptide repeat protein [Actinomadura xylanilytica]
MSASAAAEGGPFNEVGAGSAQNLIQARDIDKIVNVYGGALDRRPQLHALPAAESDFENRERVFELLDELAGTEREPGRPAMALLTGLPGSGRRAAAKRWAHDRADRFPDGRFFIDFAGPGGRDVTGPADLLASLLGQLGVPEDDVRASPDLHALWRSGTTGRKMLVVLANVEVPGQIEYALPPSNEAMVLVTTDRDLSDVASRYGAERITLRPLGEDASRALLTRLAGPGRVAAEPVAAGELLNLCGGWPQALRHAGGWLRLRQGREISAAVRRMRAPGGPGEWEVEAVSDGTYAALPDRVRRAYALLGLHPAADDRLGTAAPTAPVTFVLPAAAALLGVGEDATADVLEELIDWNLLDEEGGRYSFHDRVRRHAHRMAQDSAEREAAVLRVAEWYLTATVAADLAVNPYRPTFGALYEEFRGVVSPFGSERETAEKRALRWLEIEHRNICATVYAAADRGRHDLVVQLCEAQWALQLSARPYGTLLPVLRKGLDSARETGDPRWVFRLGTQLGRGCFETGRFPEAREVLQQALAAARATGDPLNEATAHEFLGRSYLDAGAFAEARPYFVKARGLEERHGRWRGVAINLHHLARTALGLGDIGAAIEACDEAAAIFGGLGPRPDRYNLARVALTRGRALLRGHHEQEGLESLLLALDIMRAEGRLYQEAQILEELAEASPSGPYLEQAIAAYDRLGSPRADDLRLR